MKTALCALLFTVSTLASAAETLDLSGTWRFELDRSNTGRDSRWFARPLQESISLPGSVQAAERGDPVTVDTKWTGGIFDRSWFTDAAYARYRSGQVKVPFWLQPTTHYTGIAWYQRDIEVPAAWSGRRLRVRFERPHWKTTLWLDDREVGSSDALSVPHEYDLGLNLAAGRHRLTVRVDNTLNPDVGENSHSVSDHTQGNWNGLMGRLELIAGEPTRIANVQVFPDLAANQLNVRGRVQRPTDAGPSPRVEWLLDGAPTGEPTTIAADGTFSARVPLGAATSRWDEFSPNLHVLEARLAGGEGTKVTFGLRDFRRDGRRLLLNGRPVFLRGTLDCAAYPRTGAPPTDVETWRKVLRTLQAHGLNHVRFHSWCPPEAAFVAGDELGFLFQIEVASWPNQSTTLGDGKPVDAWIDAETARILEAYGNHPSFVLLCAGNEPGGPNYVPWLTAWVQRQKAADSRRLYTSGAGWPELDVNDYHVTPEPRIQHWGEGLRSRINAAPPETITDYTDFILTRAQPVVSHEIGQWCVYPNFAEMPKYTGYLKPRNFEIFAEGLREHGMEKQAHDFLIASGKLQALCYKEDIESALRTPGMGGFQLLGLNDFPGQGTALVGVLDAFWEEKGYITPAEFHRFSSSTVPLVRLPKRVFTTDERLTGGVEVAHYGPAELKAATTEWRLVGDDNAVVAKGQLAKHSVPTGALTSLGALDVSLAKVATPARYRLVVAVRGADSPAAFENDWDVWVYPPAKEVARAAPPAVWLTRDFDQAARRRLAEGGTVLLNVRTEHVAPDPQRGAIALGFSSIFWNTAWTNGQAPHTLGILCDPKHPALRQFPTDPWSNWQWWYAVSRAAPLLMDRMPGEVQPIVQVIDDWVTNRKLALVFEARVGTGRLLVTSIELADAVLDPVRRQLRASLLAYAASQEFQPRVQLTPEQVASLLKP